CQYQGNKLNGAAMCGMVQKVDWNGNLLWQYTYSTSSYCTHHDICPMPNGNVLLISYDVRSATEVAAAGCSKTMSIWSEKIIEVKPTGLYTGEIVWEWQVWDHLVQEYSSAKNNYGVVKEHPELYNINYNTQQDWMHANGISYNESLNQIVFSSHNLNELYVIDHSTTTEEAAGHTGGNSGKGGDILYRWGNPAAYGATGTKIFNVVHDAHWVPEYCPNGGYLAAFNNGGTGSKSTIDLISPPYSGYNYTHINGSAYAPTTYTSRYVCNGRSGNQSNSQQLPNGNMLICLAESGYMYEIDASQNIVWTYTAGGTVSKAFRYTADYVTGVTETIVPKKQINIYPNPTTGTITIDGTFNQNDYVISIYNVTGQLLLRKSNSKTINIGNLDKGVYNVQIETENEVINKRIILTK
ncbi:MAG: hypothetical protein A2X12_09005, partial [Bacteroidetes bacterium GWE2_29_8]